MGFEIVHKPTFSNGLLALPRERMGQVLEKVELLREDPKPHGELKKKLHGYKGDVYRLRSGDYRIVYTYGDGWVTLLGVDDRKDVYKGDRLAAEEPAFAVTALHALDQALTPAPPPAHTARTTAATSTALPVRLDDALLARLRVPAEHWPALRACRTVDDLIAAAIPDDVRERVFDAASVPDYDSALDQPSYVTGGVDDLLRFAEGELLGFLLKLGPEQERFVSWAVDAAGPTLVKGGPGTGKSTIALYRVRALLGALRRQGVARPRILFTTYTTALVSYSQSLLRNLLGDDARQVEVRTADSLAFEIARLSEHRLTVAEPGQVANALQAAVAAAPFEGNALQRRAQGETITRLSPDYLLEEMSAVIEGRALATLDDYLAAARPGRVISLNATQRRAVWAVYQAFTRALERSRLVTWSGLRRRAGETVRAGKGPKPYDAVVVDEAQDLEPTVLRLLVALCPAPNRLFVTADANQSIYGSGFRWHDVHESLRFQGRTGILRTNYRTTREIGEAAQAYLAGGILDDEPVERAYQHNGPPPAARAVASGYDEAQLLARFLPGAAHAFRLSCDACAVLVPSEKAGTSLAAELTARGVEASYMPGRDLDLSRRCVKVMTLKSAKGLEFPVVALAGFVNATYPVVPKGASAEEETEILRRERRTLFVGMTRAMRALLVITPANRRLPVLSGIEPSLWNLGAEEG